MNRVVHWLSDREHRVFFWVNRRIQHFVLDKIFSGITHAGGASATIVFALAVALWGPGIWHKAGLQSCIALALSHIPVAIVKKKYPRLRPYLVLPGTHTCKNPLTDHSFPSGHTTAIFSVVVPLVWLQPWLGIILLPLASIVGLSRIYLGQHYPSDCLAGAVIGTGAALGTVAIFP
ncbi:phosphatase PAP2 family protein [Paenibacillus hamazuiensis]|uniref:phosphatase PAP2 family protein n=1 Tax=Paenibacillus hamazuiensis TaxID=2936508 RepID=UPI00200CAFD8|nr:phosphatase PAP2 family protein [Paenibacillus hamazuiensis]